MANSRITLRKRIWEQGNDPSSTDIAESFRDVDQALAQVMPLKIIKATITYRAGGFDLSYDHAPEGVLLIRARLATNPVASITPTLAPVDFTWSGTTIHVREIYNWGAGQRYDAVFLIIG